MEPFIKLPAPIKIFLWNTWDNPDDLYYIGEFHTKYSIGIKPLVEFNQAFPLYIMSVCMEEVESFAYKTLLADYKDENRDFRVEINSEKIPEKLRIMQRAKIVSATFKSPIDSFNRTFYSVTLESQDFME